MRTENLNPEEKNGAGNNFIQKIKDNIANIVIAIIAFAIIIPHGIILALAFALSLGELVFLPIIIISLVVYGLTVIILILIYKEIESKAGKIIFFIVLILILLFYLISPLLKLHELDPYSNYSIFDCDKIKDTKKDILGETKKDFCYFKVAQRDRDIAICDKIELKRSREDCYWDVSRDKNDLNYCLKAKEKEACYITYAMRQSWDSRADGGISTCKMITDKELKKICCLKISSLQGVDENKRAMCLREISSE